MDSEQAGQDIATQFEALKALVRALYREKPAREILDTFEVALASMDELAQQEVIAHWLDFYRLQRYKRLRQRRRPRFQERVTACSACGYPMSQRHHLWDLATHGENKVTIQLCGNCHELQHLMYNALVKGSEYSRKLAIHVLFSGRITQETGVKLLGWCLATIRYETTNGWITPGFDQREWIETCLHWSEFLMLSAVTAPDTSKNEVKNTGHL